MRGLRGRPLGLRARIVGVVLFTAVATLAVAAVALLGPLENSLRNAEKATLVRVLGPGNKTVARSFADLPLGRAATSVSAQGKVRHAQKSLADRLGAETVVVRHDPGPGGYGSRPVLLTRALGATEDDGDTLDDVAYAFRTGRREFSFGTIDGLEYARAAIPFTDAGIRYVLEVRKSVAEIPDVARAVRRAFLDAALAGLALTLILGIPLSARLVRRLRRLREAALELAQEGPSVEVPVDRARDEVGALGRTLALMQQRLGQQEEARRAFVATASHELRTPLASLEGMLELLREDLGDARPDLEDARTVVERAHAQARRLGRLASDLLDLSRLDARVDLRSEPVELGELSRAVLAEFELGSERHEISCVLDDDGGSVWALGDPGSIAQILRILLDNAVRASPTGAKIEVTLARAPLAQLSVSDRGVGVEPGEREAIFERFRRGRAAAGQAGFGLGLAIGRELARRMGGELVLEDRPGPGATFTLRLPPREPPDQEPVAVS